MPDTTTLVNETFAQVLEAMAFMFADPAQHGDLPHDCDRCLRGELTYRGAGGGGALTLMTSASVAEELASNLLSLEPGACDPESARDALGELMNVTLGRLLTSLAGAAPVFDLAPPNVTPAQAGEWDRMRTDPEAQALVVDGRAILMRFTHH